MGLADAGAVAAEEPQVVPLQARHAAAFGEMIEELEAAGEPFERYRERLGVDWEGAAGYIAFWGPNGVWCKASSTC